MWTYRDGSSVTGKMLAKAAGTTPADVPWLRLAVASHAGAGIFDRVGTLLRTDTMDGMLLGACEVAGGAKDVPYEADYTFLIAP